MGMIGGDGQVHEQDEIKSEQVMEVFRNLKNEKTAGVDGIMAVMFKV